MASPKDPRTLPWDQLPPGRIKAKISVVFPDGRRMNAYDYEVMIWRQRLQKGEIPPQSRPEICDWVQDPVTKHWERSWNSERQTCSTHPEEQRRRSVMKQLEKPEKVPSGPDIIHPDDLGGGEGAKISSAKMLRFRALVVPYLRASLLKASPGLQGCSELTVMLVEILCDPQVDKALRIMIARAILHNGWMSHLDLRTWRESERLSLAENALNNALGPSALYHMALSMTVRFHFKRILAALPGAISELKSRFPVLAEIQPRDHELLAYFLACHRFPGALRMATDRLNAYLPTRFELRLTGTREFTRPMLAAGQVLLQVKKP